MSVSLPSIASEFRGGWQRTLYAEPATEPYQQADTTTQVVWLQGEHWHADIRLPANGPDFSGITGLEECDRRQLEWLVKLTAFAGITQIEGEGFNSLCTWHRYQDLCPSLERDVGLLRWIDDSILEEQHPHGRYVEHWQRISDNAAEEVIRCDEQGHLRWLQLGDHAMAISPRPLTARSADLFVSPSSLTDDTLRWRASLCFDYLQRLQEGWQIVLSTQPWRVGEFLEASSFIQSHCYYHSESNNAFNQIT
ncbi:hypothetical protein [Vreelandella boliviensis]|uniref:DUF3445 domain-containing protein n=1 Tax=Vreelandella boliviensis LC1 TaxID=1072583 RepID=A0A265DXW6_9GAMM|nr:hypothetical protein [Halomonas boliviensis]EHJ91256.1 hypothetical protein KUC_3699 [Halomonas boliviensis LC1]OZT74100.1 hypothetical protein CE457_11615 [Halomonas boliviensis LC1]